MTGFEQAYVKGLEDRISELESAVLTLVAGQTAHLRSLGTFLDSFIQERGERKLSLVSRTPVPINQGGPAGIPETQEDTGHAAL